MPNLRPFTAVLLLALGACATKPPAPPPVQVARLPPPTLPPTVVTPPRFGAEELRCLALTVYWEDRSASHLGQLAVAHVVLNRLRDPRFPKTICGVVHDGGARPLHKCQFSWWCDGKSDEPRNAAQWAVAQAVAREATQPGSEDPSGGALFFHADGVRPPWSRTHRRTAQIGGHFFYR